MSSEKCIFNVGDLVIRIKPSRWPEEFGYMNRVYRVTEVFHGSWPPSFHITLIDVDSGQEFTRGSTARYFDFYEQVPSVPEPLDGDLI